MDLSTMAVMDVSQAQLTAVVQMLYRYTTKLRSHLERAAVTLILASVCCFLSIVNTVVSAYIQIYTAQ